MAIDPNTLYGLKGSQVEDLARRINASGSGIIELTSEDYDYPVGAADGVALWALDEGVYFAENNVKIYANSTKDFSSNPKTIVITKTKNPGVTYSASIYVLLASGIYTYSTRQDGSQVPSSGGYVLRDTDLQQTTGGSTTIPMSQDATSKMIFQDAGTDSKRIRIGGGDTSASVGLYSIGIGYGSGLKASDNYTIAMGNSAEATGLQSMAFGIDAKAFGTSALAFSTAVAQGIDSVALPHSTFAWTPTPGDYTTTQGVFAVDCGRNNHGYKNSIYRVIRGVHDGEELYDAATVAQGNTLATSAPTTATKGALGQLYTDTTAMHTYQCTAIDDTDPNNILYTWTQRW